MVKKWFLVNITMTSSLRLKSHASQLFNEQGVQANNKENIKAPNYWTFVGESTGD